MSYPIRAFIAFIQNRTGICGLPFLYIFNSILSSYVAKITCVKLTPFKAAEKGIATPTFFFASFLFCSMCDYQSFNYQYSNSCHSLLFDRLFLESYHTV